MMEKRHGDWMQTYTGKAFWPLDPLPAEVDIIDIAHALSNACRFAGHCRRFYSVAEHSVLLARHFADPVIARWALLHDATEAYLVDVPRPLKPFLPGYRTYEAKLMAVIAERFGLVGFTIPDAVKEADNRILLDERAQAMAASERPWNLAGDPLGVTLAFWSPELAEHFFLSTWKQLQ